MTSGRQLSARAMAARPSYAMWTVRPSASSSSASSPAASALLSASSTRRARVPSSGAGTSDSALGSECARKGSITRMRVPWPAPALTARTVPPCRPTSERTTARPMPRPGVPPRAFVWRSRTRVRRCGARRAAGVRVRCGCGRRGSGPANRPASSPCGRSGGRSRRWRGRGWMHCPAPGAAGRSSSARRPADCAARARWTTLSRQARTA